MVLGGRRVGKSTFIQRALDLRDNVPTALSSKKMSLDDVIYVVRLFEVLTDDITINETKKITWPKLLEEQKPLHIDGILILYDVTNGESVVEIPDILCESGSTRASMLSRAAFLLLFPTRA